MARPTATSTISRVSSSTSSTVTTTVTVDNNSGGSSSSSSRLQETLVLELRPRKKKVTWKEGTVDNEFMNKKSSKICCVFHKEKPFDEDDSDDDCHDHDHHHHPSNGNGFSNDSCRPNTSSTI